MRVMNREAEAEMITEQAVLSALAAIQGPDLRCDIVSLGFVKGLRIASYPFEHLRALCPCPSCAGTHEKYQESATAVQHG
jgi:metal-sulfur cluster biosynthetic enzyme